MTIPDALPTCLHTTQAYETADGKLDTQKREAALLVRYQEVRGYGRGRGHTGEGRMYMIST